MAITQGMTTSYKQSLFNTGVTYRMALYTSVATLGPGTTAYTSTNEVTGAGYTAGGQDMSGVQVTTDGTTAIVDFADVTWANATITARGALIYIANGTTNPSVAVIDFGSDRTATGGNFVVTMPAPAAATALIRFA